VTRRIMLTLAEDTTDDECGGCPQFGYHGYQQALAECGIFSAIDRARSPECLAAEREAERLGEAKR
jgi:hypothetical protein